MNVTENTAAALDAKANQHFADSAESFDRCDTDGFVSQWASDISGRKAQRNAEIARNGGVATFWAYEVTDLNGNPLNFRRANTKYGFKLVVEFPTRDEVWIDPDAKRPETNAKKGVKVSRRSFTAPAHAILWSPPGARGLSGATSVQIVTVPDDRNLKFDGVSL